MPKSGLLCLAGKMEQFCVLCFAIEQSSTSLAQGKKRKCHENGKISSTGVYANYCWWYVYQRAPNTGIFNTTHTSDAVHITTTPNSLFKFLSQIQVIQKMPVFGAFWDTSILLKDVDIFQIK
ncbi:hypothetical protein DFH08DRAFT_812012 [Mycena albidolilacea]|uniref:Uncharacterized protein n=1 Tax=Mycena albidolilacea TaxID=1033008 RepID=A0AAD6ZW62_9AGAR|nr:hypothetical protein DFH08DRAFT_812012 [Mycena albidolilacea]